MSQALDANIIFDIFRGLFAFIDWVAFWLLSVVYQVFFVLANTKFLNADILSTFQSRIQLLLGVFMLFKLGVSVIEGLVEPDKFTDKKTGAGSIIVRILTVLVMLTLLLPINNIPATNCNESLLNMSSKPVSYNCQLKNNGVLFGILYSFQDRILARNTIGRLVLGETATKSETNFKTVSSAGNNMANDILGGFVQINLKSGSKDYMCANTGDVKAAYSAYNSNVRENLLGIINVKCDNPNDNSVLFKDKVYAFAYIPILGTVIAIIFSYLLIRISVDIAVRVVKLGLLQLIAPIPIISYIDPKQNEKGSFGTWVKTTTTTYLDLFIYLASVYFAIFLVEEMAEQIIRGKILESDAGFLVSVLVFAVIAYGIFKFAADAPKFIKQALGVKEESGFGSFAKVLDSGLVGGASAGMEAFARRKKDASGAEQLATVWAATKNGAINGIKNGDDARAQGKALPLGSVWRASHDKVARDMSGNKEAQGGILGRAVTESDAKFRENVASSYGIGGKDLAKADYIEDALKQSVENATAAREKAKNKVKSMETNGRMRNKADFVKDLAGTDAESDLIAARNTLEQLGDKGQMLTEAAYAMKYHKDVTETRITTQQNLVELQDNGKQYTKESFATKYKEATGKEAVVDGKFTADFDNAYVNYQNQYAAAEVQYNVAENAYINAVQQDYADYQIKYNSAVTEFQNASANYDVTTQTAYENYVKEYKAAVSDFENSEAKLQAQQAMYEKAQKDTKRIKDERSVMHLSPDVSEVEGHIGARTNYKVITNEKGIAIDKKGNELNAVLKHVPIADPEHITDAERKALDEAQKQYARDRQHVEDNLQYEQSLKKYRDTLDDSTIASLGGGPSGPPPRQ